MSLSPECHELLQSLEHATARLARQDREDPRQLDRALCERKRALDAVTAWIAAEQRASRPVSTELASHLARDLESGAEILVRLALAREATRVELMSLGRELQMLQSLNTSAPLKPTAIDCQG